MRGLALLFFFITFTANAQSILTKWTFDQETLLPDYGEGIAVNIGETTSAFVSGNPGKAWNTAHYPEQGTSSATAGVQFTVSTEDRDNITISWLNRLSNTAANRLRLQYTMNGTEWINFQATAQNATNTSDGIDVGFDNGAYVADTGTVWFERSADLSAITGVNNNDQFAIRLVTEFADGTSYSAASPGSDYGTTGTIRYDNVIFSGCEIIPLLTANPGNLSGYEYMEGEGPSESQSFQLSGVDLIPENGSVVVDAPEYFEVSVDGYNFSNALPIPYTGSTLAKTIYVRLKEGLSAGAYDVNLSISGGGANDISVLLSGSVTPAPVPVISNEIVPLYIQGKETINNYRVPFAWQATLCNLKPDATYRYYNKVVVETDTPDFNGAGNTIFANSDGTFIRTMETSMDTPGEYGEFTTDATGCQTVWFITEPSGNDRFTPGNHLYMRININDGNNGTVEDARLTTSHYSRVLEFGTEHIDTQGTAIRSVSYDDPGDFVFLYNGTNDAMRPVYGTPIESTGIDFCASGVYAPFYCHDVAGINGSWGGIIPNNNPEGIQMIKVFDKGQGSLLQTYAQSSGVWIGTDTRNPSGGADTVLVIDLQVIGVNSPETILARIWSGENEIIVQPSMEGKHTFTLYSMSGYKVGSFIINGKQTIPVNLSSGIYIGQLQNESSVITVKVLIK